MQINFMPCIHMCAVIFTGPFHRAHESSCRLKRIHSEIPEDKVTPVMSSSKHSDHEEREHAKPITLPLKKM